MATRTDTLLVIDDNPLNCGRTVGSLAQEGFEVSSVEDARAALKWIGKNRVDLVLLSLEMPNQNGFRALSILREKYDPAQLPIIVVTNKTGSKNAVNALNAGANDYFTKSVDFAILLARIQAQLSRKHAEEALRESEERYALAVLGANDGLWDWNFIKNEIYFSPRWKSMLGWEENEIENKPDEWFRRIHPDDADRVRADIAAHLKEQTQHYEGEYRIQHRDGHYLWMLGRGIAVRGDNGKACRMAGSQTDITQGKVVDVLTGLPNRVLFMDRLGRSFRRAQRSDNKSFALIFLDLDSFKLINDSLGHLIGDQMLVTIAGRLETTLRSCDTISRLGQNHTVARLGGDEFTILLEDVSIPNESTTRNLSLQPASASPCTIRAIRRPMNSSGMRTQPCTARKLSARAATKSSIRTCAPIPLPACKWRAKCVAGWNSRSLKSTTRPLSPYKLKKFKDLKPLFAGITPTGE